MDTTQSAEKPIYYLRQTLFSSPLVSQFFHNFNVRIPPCDDMRYQNTPTDVSKWIVEKRLMTPFLWQELTEPTESMDTFMDEGDDEIVEDLASDGKIADETQAPDITGNHQNKQENLITRDTAKEDRYAYVDVEVHPTSIQLNRGKRFNLHCKILSAAILPACLKSKGEDSLILILETQILLIIRMHITNMGDLEPVIVQRLSLARDKNNNKLTQLGFSVTCNNLGTFISVSAFSKVIKLYEVEYDIDGIPKILESMNILIGGMILKHCFLSSTTSTYAAMLCLTLDDSNILHLQLNELGLGNRHGSILIKSYTTALSVKFEMPDFIVPLPRTGGVLFIQRSQLSVKSPNFFFSREDFESQTLQYPLNLADTPATCYYIPKSKITCLRSEEYNDDSMIMDQVLISYKSRKMFLLDVFYMKRKCEWKLRFNKLFVQGAVYSFFSLEEITKQQYDLTYFNDDGVSVNKLISLVPRKNGKSGFGCSVLNEEKYGTNWHPLYDFTVVPSLHSKYCDFLTTEELWCLGRRFQKGSLFHLHVGLTATSNCISRLFENSSRLYKYEEQGETFYVASSLNQSIVFRYSSSKSVGEYKNKDSSSPLDICNNLYVPKQTIHFGKLEHDRFIQVFSDSWRIGKFSCGTCFNVLKSSFRITLASSLDSFVALAYEKSVGNKLMVDIQCFKIDTENNTRPILLSLPNNIYGQPSMLEFVCFNSKIILFIGLTNGELISLCWNESMECFSILNRLDLNTKPGSCVTPVISYSLTAINKKMILITTIDGQCLVLEADVHLKKVAIISRLKLGHSPVNITRINKQKFILACGSLWKVDYGQCCYPTEIVEHGWSRRCYRDCVSIPQNSKRMCEDFIENAEMFLVLGRNGLNELFLSDFKSVQTEKIPLGVTGIKLEYYKHLRMFIIIPSATNSRNDDKLIFIDHKSRKMMSSNVTAINLFQKDEYPVSLFEWKVDSRSSNTKRHHLLLVGCKKGNYGSIKIVEVRKASGTVSLKILNSWKEDFPILALNQLNDSTIVYGCGDSLKIKKYDPVACHVAATVNIAKLLSNIKYITINQRSNLEEIIVNTEKDSFSRFLLRADGTVKALQSDFVSRRLAARYVVHASDSGDPLITIADKQYPNILSIKLTDYNVQGNSSAVKAQARIPYIPRILSCDFTPMWMKDYDRSIKNCTILGKFLSVGLAGEASLFTIVQGHTIEKLYEKERAQYENSSRQRFLALQTFCPQDFGNNLFSKAGNINVVDADTCLSKTCLTENPDIAWLLHSSLV